MGSKYKIKIETNKSNVHYSFISNERNILNYLRNIGIYAPLKSDNMDYIYVNGGDYIHVKDILNTNEYELISFIDFKKEFIPNTLPNIYCIEFNGKEEIQKIVSILLLTNENNGQNFYGHIEISSHIDYCSNGVYKKMIYGEKYISGLVYQNEYPIITLEKWIDLIKTSEVTNSIGVKQKLIVYYISNGIDINDAVNKINSSEIEIVNNIIDVKKENIVIETYQLINNNIFKL